jgi:hypothetical protein
MTSSFLCHLMACTLTANLSYYSSNQILLCIVCRFCFCNEQAEHLAVEYVPFITGKQVTQNAKHCSIRVPVQCAQAIIASWL